MADLQKNKICRLRTPLEDDQLLVSELWGKEGISELFRFELDLVSKDTDIDFRSIIGKNVTVEIELQEDRKRLINGIVSRFRQVDTPDIPLEEAEVKAFYWAEIVPWPWFLTRRQDCRIFQNMTVQEIVKKVFGDLGFSDFDFRLGGSYDPLVNCVQYQESDFAFVSRLLESAGIFYFFEHEDSRHIMVLADSPDQNVPVPDLKSAIYTTGARTGEAVDRIHSWKVEEVLQPGKYALTDYNFFDPATDLLVNSSSTLDQPGADKYEIFTYPGDFVNLGGESDAKLAKGESLVKLRMEEGDARAVTASGRTSCRAFLPGFRFDLDGHPRKSFNQSWLLTGVVHDLDQRAALSRDSDEPVRYENRVTCIPHRVTFRPARVTPRPRIPGAQTAQVVGPGGEEIYVDKHGRVKVKFYWDRYGGQDETSSCWVRVAQNWAGKQWGILFHPRIGQEVVVEFLDGDPDRPLITGRVYNAAQPIPFEGPTQSGIQTRSSPDGSGDNFNQIRFEDMAGSEEIYIHAEKNLKTVVEADEVRDVGAAQSIVVGSNKSVEVKDSHTEKIGADMSLTVGGDRGESIGGNRTESVSGKQETSIGKNYSENVGAARTVAVSGTNSTTIGKADSKSVGASSSLEVSDNRTVKVGKNTQFDSGDKFVVKAKKILIEAKDELAIKVGKAQLVMKKNGEITLTGKDMNFKGKKINIKGSGDVIVKGSKIAQN